MPRQIVNKTKRIRPPKREVITPEVIAHVEKLSGLGLTKTQIHNYYGMSETAWRLREEAHPTLEIAITRGRAKRLETVTGKLWEKIEQGNLSAIIFYLKTQAQWREKEYNDDGSNPGNRDGKIPPVMLVTTDPVEAAKIYQQIMLGS